MTQAEYNALSYFEQMAYNRNPVGFEMTRNLPLPDAELQYAVDLLGHIPGPSASQWERFLGQLWFEWRKYMTDMASPPPLGTDVGSMG
jgi:hypothetical protein